MPTVAKIGNVVKQDPELQFSVGGKAFTRFSLAVKPYVPKGQPQPETQYYEVTAFGSLAENVAECLHKGNRVVVVGDGKTETWTGKDGKERTSKVILAEAIGPDLRFVVATLNAPDKGVTAPTQLYENEEAF